MAQLSLGSCNVCKKPCKSVCSGCKEVYYCCEEHQLYDWDQHSSNCVEEKTSHAEVMKYERRKAVAKFLIEGQNEQAVKFARALFKTSCRESRLSKGDPPDDVFADGLLLAKALLQCDMIAPARETLLKVTDAFESSRMSKSTSDLSSRFVSKELTLQSLSVAKKLKVLSALASQFEACGESKQGEKLYVDYVSLVENYYGVSSLEASDSYFQMGNYYLTKSLLEKAAACYRRALTLRSQLLGEETLSVSDCFFNLGVVFAKKQCYNKALAWFDKARIVRESVCSEHGLPTAHVYEKLGRVHLSMQNVEAAYDFALKAWNVYKAVYRKENDEHNRIRTLLVKIDQAVEVLSPSKRHSMKVNSSKALSSKEFKLVEDRSLASLKENIADITQKLRQSSLLKSRSSAEVMRKDSLSQSPIYKPRIDFDNSRSDIVSSAGSDWQSMRSLIGAEGSKDREEDTVDHMTSRTSIKNILEEHKDDANSLAYDSKQFESNLYKEDSGELKSYYDVEKPEDSTGLHILSRELSEGELSFTTNKIRDVEDFGVGDAVSSMILSNVKQFGFEKFLRGLLTLDDSIPLDLLEQLTEWTQGSDYPREASTSSSSSFIGRLSEIPRFQMRLKALELKQNYKTEFQQIKDALTVLRTAAEEITTSQSFLEFLKVVTKLGSSFNSGRNLHMSTINKMFSLKVAGNSDFLTYLVSVLLKQRPQVLAFPEDFKSLKEGLEINIEELNEWLNDWAGDLKLMETESQAAMTEKDYLFYDHTEAWLKQALAQLARLKTLSESTTLTFDALKAYIGDEQDLLRQVERLADAVAEATLRARES
mmetsp:Transcript_11162/g.21945  ORF Transcript_11162/g.21945 Transcript_11162/m.21945 type:complete len:821 (+) Transcript_11162:1165-3627(+)|eukprot:CAMPEP_0204913238 /NCGR_PEP_ID=MMETSP1397-20131031/11182_1 /ASSEMBLY_ACC=CAM_ASM_000891 /TAXON_ID=49980 /ORGANISM="Climacostomum Climacostomum virens, Strain Stock W-24" /LENGTH=820 /DNA_ID=CAMNT_0052084433 /DNA_START=1288 /DNA_END=3750 /DNA_ORIENTATION=-